MLHWLWGERGVGADRRPVALCRALPVSIHLAENPGGPAIKRLDSERPGLRGIAMSDAHPQTHKKQQQQHNAGAIPPLAVMRMCHRPMRTGLSEKKLSRQRDTKKCASINYIKMKTTILLIYKTNKKIL